MQIKRRTVRRDFFGLAPQPVLALLRSVMSPVTRRVVPRRGVRSNARFAPAGPASLASNFAHVQGGGSHLVYPGGTSITFTFGSAVTVGNLVIVGVADEGGNGSLTFTVTDSGGNTWTNDILDGVAYSQAQVSHSVITTGGALTITVTTNQSHPLTMSADEFSFSAGMVASVDGAPSGATSTSATSLTTSLIPLTTGLIYGVAAVNQATGQAIAHGPGFTAGSNITGVSNGAPAFLAEYVLANSTSPIAVIATLNQSDANGETIVGVAFKAVQPPIFPSPSTVPANHSGNISVTLVGSGTNWVSGSTTFTATGAGVTFKSQSIANTTAATIVITTGSSTGTCTISDGTNSATITVATASLSLNPPGIGENASQTITATGTHTLWSSEVASTLFSISGVSGASISSIAVTSNTVATFTLAAVSSSGTAIITSTEATASFPVYAIAPGITLSPGSIPVNTSSVTLTLLGVHTNWVSGSTTFSATGVSIASSTITSTTAATIVITTGTATGTATISDGSYTGPLAVLGGVVSQAYVGRSAQLAYFLTAGSFDTYAPSSAPVPIYSIVSTSVTNGGSGYTSPKAIVTGGGGVGCVLGTPIMVSGVIASIPVAVPGSGYTSAPTIAITDRTGRGATIAPVLGGSPSAVTAVNSNPTIEVNSHAVAVALYLNSITVTAGGSSYTSATLVVISGGHGSGATATATVAGGHVASIQVTNPGWGFLAGDTLTITITDSGGGSGATAAAVLGPVWTNSSYACPFVAYQMLCGSVSSVLVQKGGSNYNSPVATATGGSGTGLVLGTPTLVNGVITAVNITGTNTHLAGDVISITDPAGTGSGFVGYYTVSNPGVSGTITGVVVENGGSGYSNGSYAAAYNASYTFISITLVNGVIKSIPVTSPGSGYTSAPTITITDGGSGSGAVAVALMSGPAPTDVVTYSAPANWLSTSSGSVPAATSVPMLNFAGQLEPAFTAPATMQLGMDLSPPNGAGSAKSTNQNWIKGTQANWTGANPPAVTISDSTGTLATAVGIVNPAGHVTGYTVSCGGVGYTSPTAVVDSPPSGTTATVGTITVSGGVITAIALGAGGAGYGGSTIDGHPIAINNNKNVAGVNTGYPNTFASFSVATGGQNNGTDNQGLPDQTGIWTFVADEASPSTPMTVSVYEVSTATWITAAPVSGTIVGGVEVGKKWLFNVTRPGGAWNLNLNLNVAGPSVGASAPWTLSNEYMIAPARGTRVSVLPNRSNPMAPDQNMLDWLSMPGGPHPTSLRTDVFGGYNWGDNVVDASDLRSPTDFCWGDGPQRSTTVTVTAIRAYQIWSGSAGYYSPYVWTNDSYPGTFPTSGLTSGQISSAWGATTPPPYYWVPPGNASANNIQWVGKGAGNNHLFVSEFVTAAPHGLKTGQLFYIPSNTLTNAVPVYDPNASSSSDPGSPTSTTASLANLYLSVYVTSATTFVVMTQYTYNLSAGDVANTIGVNTLNFTATFEYAPGENAVPYEAFTSLVSSIPGCGLHPFIPTFATAACVAVIAQRIRDTLPVGRLVYPETINEHWNYGSPDFQNEFAMSTLLSAGTANIRSANPHDFYTWLASRNHEIFVSVFNARDINGNTNRGNSIVRVFGGQGVDNAWAGGVVEFANLYNATSPAVPIQIDAIMTAVYLDIPSDLPIVAAAASTYSNYPGSLQYQSTTPWTMGMYVDFFRHFTLYYTAGQFDSNNSIIPTYNLVPGQTAAPFMIIYEAATELLVPPGVSTTDWNIRPFITHDAYFHPFFCDANRAFHLGLQSGGAALEIADNLCQHRAPGGGDTIEGQPDGHGIQVWGATTWEGMTWGRGDGSLDGNGNATVNRTFNATGLAQDLNNVSPKLQAWRDWVSASYAAPAGPVRTAKRWFPGLRGFAP